MKGNNESIICKEIIQVCKPSGRLRYFVQRWKEIISDNYIRQIKGYRILFAKISTQKNISKRRIVSELETKTLQLEIKKLIEKRAIEICEHCKGEFISQYFLVPKPDGTSRCIFNLKELNKFIEPPHFKLEDIRSVISLILVGDYMGSVDFFEGCILCSADSRKP